MLHLCKQCNRWLPESRFSRSTKYIVDWDYDGPILESPQVYLSSWCHECKGRQARRKTGKPTRKDKIEDILSILRDPDGYKSPKNKGFDKPL